MGKNIKFSYQNKTLNTASLPQGVYMLKVKTSQGNLTKKIVKQQHGSFYFKPMQRHGFFYWTQCFPVLHLYKLPKVLRDSRSH
ncbi:MAG: T9SS type A sorting domain-containing protein [Gelidibacter sp.]